MAPSTSDYCLGANTLRQYTNTLLERIVHAIKAQKFYASGKIREYFSQMPSSEISSQMNQAWEIATIQRLIEAIHTNNFDDLQPHFPSLQRELETSNQGVYAGIIFAEDGEYTIYVGSSWGTFGLRKRVFSNHLNPTYRAREPNKELYVAMKECKAATFVKLAEYSTHHPPAQVILAEASKGLNRSNPLGESTTESIGIDSVLYARQRGLSKCQQTSSYHVIRHYDAKGHDERYMFSLFALLFRIPVALARTWNLEEDPNVDVSWRVSDTLSPQRYAALATKDDDGGRVTIELSKTINGSKASSWLTTQGPEAIKVANTVHDFLVGKIVGNPDYIWETTRKYMFKCHTLVPKDGLPNAKVYPRKQKTEGERSDFIWFDGKRREESAPEGIVAKRQKNRETRRAWAWKSVSPPEQCPVEEDKTEEGKTGEDKTEEDSTEEELVEEDTTAEDKYAWSVWCQSMEKKYLDPWHKELCKKGVIVYPSRNAF
ncbi:hypothetical protein MMC22_012061 [Lobaria immixta]|nr:hypothetical protein [Lobaria immixta]